MITRQSIAVRRVPGPQQHNQSPAIVFAFPRLLPCCRSGTRGRLTRPEGVKPEGENGRAPVRRSNRQRRCGVTAVPAVALQKGLRLPSSYDGGKSGHWGHTRLYDFSTRTIVKSIDVDFVNLPR
jgi:hypothetical protein